MKQSLNIYYKLSEILNYDTYKVATVLDVYLNLNDTEHIFSKLQSLCLDEFEVALNELDKLSSEEIILMSDESHFKSESSYINYLISLLELNNVEFVVFKKKEVKSKFVTGSLFWKVNLLAMQKK